MNRENKNKILDSFFNLFYRKFFKPKNVMITIGILFITVGLSYYTTSFYDIILKILIDYISENFIFTYDIKNISSNLTFSISTGLIILGLAFSYLGYKNKIPHRKRVYLIKHSSLFKPTYPIRKYLEEKYILTGEINISLESMLSGVVIDDNTIVDALKIQDRYVNELNSLENINAVAYMGIASIPFVMRLGYMLGDEKEYIYFENRKTKNTGFQELYNYKLSVLMEHPSLNIIDNILVKESTELVIAIGLTFPVLRKEVPKSLQKFSYVYFENEDLTLKGACHDSVFSLNQLNIYREKIRDCIAINYKKNNIKKIHILYAGPASLAFSLGTMITPTHDPEVVCYQYYAGLENMYPWGISLKTADIMKCIIKTEN